MASPSLPTRARAAAWLTVVLGITSCAVPPPLSGPRAPAATSRPAQQPTPSVPAPVVSPPGPILPPVSPPPTVQTRPLESVPSIHVVGSDAIALVLPLQSRTYAQAAEAVKAGFLVAANRAGLGGRVRIIAHGDDGVLSAIELAERDGVALVVGPLTRDDLKTVISMALVHPRMLALNQTDDGLPPADTYTLALSVESDAVLLARVARDSGVRTLAVVSSEEALPRRFASSFAAAWERGPPREYRFDPNPEMLGLLRRELAASPPDGIVLAVDGSDAALAKTFLPPRPVFALSQIADDLPAQSLRDLEGARYVEIPWLAEPDNPVFAGVPRANLGGPLLERLYALGLDAFALAQMLAEPVPPERVELDGATGHLSLTPARVFSREGRVMLIHDGRVQPDSPLQ